jgi:hypothetical protein
MNRTGCHSATDGLFGPDTSTRVIACPRLNRQPGNGYRDDVIALLLVAVSLGLSNFAAAIGIGITGVDARTRLRVGVIFGAFEAGMPVLGLLLGHGLAGVLGQATRWVGAGLLISAGG